jgi:hypothetical protein
LWEAKGEVLGESSATSISEVIRGANRYIASCTIIPFSEGLGYPCYTAMMRSYRATRSRMGNFSGEAGRTAPEDTWPTVVVHCDTTFRIRLCDPT